MIAIMKRRFGASGITASAVGLGTWAIGGWMWGGTDDPLSEDAIRAGLDDITRAVTTTLNAVPG